MPRWTRVPPETPIIQTLPLRRTPPSKPMIGLITCRSFIGTYTHFYQGRTAPCEEEDCEICKQNQSARWHGYVSAITPKVHEHFLFEFTQGPAEVLFRYHQDHGSLRGALFQACRLSRRPNGRVHLQVTPQNLTGVKLPDPPDIKSILLHIWSANPVHDETESPLRIADHVAAALDRSDNGKA